MQIKTDVKFKGKRNEIVKKALIDTGAEISIVPIQLARQIGAWKTTQDIPITGIHNQHRILPLGISYIFFPTLNNIGGRFPVVISDQVQEPIIGLDILKLLGISIDTKTNQLSVKNEIWEAFKTLAAGGILLFAGVQILGEVFKNDTPVS